MLARFDTVVEPVVLRGICRTRRRRVVRPLRPAVAAAAAREVRLARRLRERVRQPRAMGQNAVLRAYPRPLRGMLRGGLHEEHEGPQESNHALLIGELDERQPQLDVLVLLLVPLGVAAHQGCGAPPALVRQEARGAAGE